MRSGRIGREKSEESDGGKDKREGRDVKPEVMIKDGEREEEESGRKERTKDT